MYKCTEFNLEFKAIVSSLLTPKSLILFTRIYGSDRRINRNTKILSALARVAVPLSKCYSACASHDAQRPSEAQQGRRLVKENELEDESQHHIDSPHQGNGAGLLVLQGLCEEGLAGNAQESHQYQHPAITATGGDFPLPKDGYGDDALDETDDCVVPDREVVMDALPNFTKDNQCKSSRNSACEGNEKKKLKKYSIKAIITTSKKHNNKIYWVYYIYKVYEVQDM